ncbi:MAG TPA: alpha/beta hydrolase [Candidatus Baltobacteraceae bacterium]
MRVAVDDAFIDVDDRGSGEPIVLLHGFPLTRAIWDRTAEILSQRYRVISPDLRGMGASSTPDGPYLMETMAGDIAAVLDACGVQRAHIVGHSLGGFVAQAFARMYVERVAGLALVGSRLAADDAQTAARREMLAQRVEAEDSVDPAIAAFEARMFASESVADRPGLVELYRTIARHNRPKGLAAVLRGMAQRAPSDDIAQDLEMPILVFVGAHDAVLSIEEARATAGAFPHGRLAVAEHSGHMPMLEEPGTLIAALDAWA